MNSKQERNTASIASKVPRFGDRPKDHEVEKQKINKDLKTKKEESEDNEEVQEQEEEQVVNDAQDAFGPKHPPKKGGEKPLDIIFDKQTRQSEQKRTDKAYHEDGDPSMYTEESLEQRNALKSDPDVKKAISKFMNLYKWNAIGQIDIEAYLFVHSALAELLRDDLSEEVSKDELRFVLEQDWAHDSRGKEYMTKDDAYDSLFELVDVWVPDIDKQEYIDFFTFLNNSLSRKGYKDPYNVL